MFCNNPCSKCCNNVNVLVTFNDEVNAPSIFDIFMEECADIRGISIIFRMGGTDLFVKCRGYSKRIEDDDCLF